MARRYSTEALAVLPTSEISLSQPHGCMLTILTADLSYNNCFFCRFLWCLPCKAEKGQRITEEVEVVEVGSVEAGVVEVMVVEEDTVVEVATVVVAVATEVEEEEEEVSSICLLLFQC